MNRLQEAFTLLELLVAVAIVSILAGVAYPSYQESIRKAKRTEGRAALMRLMQQEERYFSQNSTYITFSSNSTDEQEQKFRWYSGTSPEKSAYEIHAEACENSKIQNCVVLRAKPGTTKVDNHYVDPVCGELSFDSKGSTGALVSKCWD